MMHGHEKSHSAVVATKLPNKTGQPAAEALEPRAGTKGNMDQQSTRRTQIRESVSQALFWASPSSAAAAAGATFCSSGNPGGTV